MFAVSEVAPNGHQSSQTQTQHQVIASVMALQRVIAGQGSAESGDAASRNFSGNTANSARDKTARQPDNVETRTEDAADTSKSADARSIIEAQEATVTDRKITAAFQARHGLSDLLSVIRDPEDRMLPKAPED